MKREVITSKSSSTIRDIYNAKFIAREFAARDFKVRYINTTLGIAWAIINPLFGALIYVIAFGFIMRVKTPEYNTSYYAVLLLGLIFWNFFQQTADSVSNVLINNSHILKKVYFPRFTLNIAASITSLIDFLIAIVVILIIIFCLSTPNIIIGYRLLLLPLECIGIWMLSIGLGSILSLLKLRFKDFRHIVPIFFQGLFFLSPIVYSPSLIPEKWSFLYHLNPITGYIETARALFIGGTNIPYESWLYSIIFSILLLIIAVIIFNKNERTIMDFE